MTKTYVSLYDIKLQIRKYNEEYCAESWCIYIIFKIIKLENPFPLFFTYPRYQIVAYFIKIFNKCLEKNIITLHAEKVVVSSIVISI